MGILLQSVDGVVQEITDLCRQDRLKNDAIMKQRKGNDVAEELFFVLQEMQKQEQQGQNWKFQKILRLCTFRKNTGVNIKTPI